MIDGFHLIVISQYFKSMNDFYNVEMVCKKFNGTLQKFHCNPIPVDKTTIKHFPNIETLNIWLEKDDVFGVLNKEQTPTKKFFRVVIWFQVSYKTTQEIQDTEVVFKNVCYTMDDRIKFGDESFIIPPTIRSLGEKCFSECNKMNLIDIPLRLSGIGANCFAQCSSLKYITIPPLVYSLPSHCFLYCTSLSSVVLPDTIKSFGEFCFGYCFSLSEIKIPKSITNIGKICFYNCSTLSKIEIDKEAQIKVIDQETFWKCTSLLSFCIPQNVNSIGFGCFSECSMLTSILFSTNLSFIDNNCFYGCRALHNVTLPNALTKISEEMFGYCSQLSIIEIPQRVVELCSSCFENCSSLVSVKIPDCVTSIGHRSFACCTTLNDVRLPNNVKIIESGIFMNCFSLSKIEIPSCVSKINNYSFYNCNSLTSIVLPVGLICLNKSCFGNCYNLVKIEMDEKLESIGTSCFENCNSLKSVIIPKTVTFIGKTCFKNCIGLSSVDINNASVELCQNCFQDCCSLCLINFNFNELNKLKATCFGGVSLPSLKMNADDLVFEKSEKIGEGSCGIVYKGSLHGVPVAIKIPKNPLDDNQVDAYIHEMQLMNDSHGPNVVLFIGLVICNNIPMFVTEYIKMDLYKLVHSPSLPSEYAKRVLNTELKIELFSQCCKAIQWLHNQMNLIHRNVKPTNFLLDENFKVKVCDFGFAEIANEKEKTFGGSPMYCSPEVLNKATIFGKEIDIYSLGITMWELFYMKFPFFEHPEIVTTYQLLPALLSGVRPILPVTLIKENENNMSMKNHLEDIKKTFGKLVEDIPIEFEILMAKCWDVEPKNRPDINNLVDSVYDLKLSIILKDTSAMGWWKKTFEKSGRDKEVLVDEFLQPLIKSFKMKMDVVNCLKENIGVSYEVNLKRFQYLSGTFGKFYSDKRLFKKMIKVFQKDWWFGVCSKDEAIAKLDDKVDGTFLVRESYSVENSPITISKRSDGQLKHVRINTKLNKDGDVIYSVNAGGKEITHDSLTEMIDALIALSFIKIVCDRQEIVSKY
ncbi:serine-threonine protein kinase, putative [Entamoeba invadens IP1]|uniref:Serine-threonine protein kinase, putative n=1 Tax=Entamoeba invadens IP1 TaxID=370355 RepID=A0A0A1TXG0_ENTIV|nr:serine-threonine protein kinase, putative [Entamoeba invadens IP1]ELP85977.1 serine-threonine protein kinase, putative [Entamoeba invadens IP1]|eukprot:XP_004185323.1 serine-threonine protein kinase, putative [Entamoeba invadens IP1]